MSKTRSRSEIAGRTSSSDFPQVRSFASRFSASVAGDVPFLTVLDDHLSTVRRSTFVSAEEQRGFLTAFAANARYSFVAAGIGPLATGEMFVRKIRTLPVREWLPE